MPSIQIGNKYGRLTVVSKGKLVGGNRYWFCKCECGNTKEICYSSLARNVSKSCGCLNAELSGSRWRTHGKSKTTTHNVWLGIKQRCYDQNCNAYLNYGARGITVDARWLESFDNFLADMGERPTGKSLERIDNNKGYSKSNCVWATSKEQANNRRSNLVYEYQGKALNLTQWAEESGIPYFTLRARVQSLGWNIDKALTQAIRRKQAA
jgi:hypothetical protein